MIFLSGEVILSKSKHWNNSIALFFMAGINYVFNTDLDFLILCNIEMHHVTQFVVIEWINKIHYMDKHTSIHPFLTTAPSHKNAMQFIATGIHSEFLSFVTENLEYWEYLRRKLSFHKPFRNEQSLQLTAIKTRL